MKGIYKAVEVSSPGRLRVVERSVPEPGAGQFGFAWKHAEICHTMPPRSLAFIRVSLCRASWA